MSRKGGSLLNKKSRNKIQLNPLSPSEPITLATGGTEYIIPN